MYVVLAKVYKTYIYDCDCIPYSCKDLEECKLLTSGTLDCLHTVKEKFCAEEECYRDKNHFTKAEFSAILKVSEVIASPESSEFFLSLLAEHKTKEQEKGKKRKLAEKLLAERAKAKERLLYLRLKKKYDLGELDG